MKSSRLSLLLTALLISYPTIQAEPNKENHKKTHAQARIVTVKIERIVKESSRGKKIQDKIAKEQKKLSAPFEKVEVEMRKKEADVMEKVKSLDKEKENFQAQFSLLSADARIEKQEELEKKRRDLEEDKANFQRAVRIAHEDAKKVEQKLEMMYRKEMMTFEQDIRTLIHTISKSEGWNIVLAEENIIYSDVDVTDIVVQKLDEKEETKSSAKDHAK